MARVFGGVTPVQEVHLQKPTRYGDNLSVANANPFQPGAMVIVTLGNPRDKFWGAILGMTMEGLSLCGVELASFDDLVAMIKEGEQAAPGIVFFPMHRVERMELDLADGDVPSLSQRFTKKTGLDAVRVLTEYHAQQTQPAEKK